MIPQPGGGDTPWRRGVSQSCRTTASSCPTRSGGGRAVGHGWCRCSQRGGGWAGAGASGVQEPCQAEHRAPGKRVAAAGGAGSGWFVAGAGCEFGAGSGWPGPAERAGWAAATGGQGKWGRRWSGILGASPPREGERVSMAYRIRLLLDRWNLWPRLTMYREWRGGAGREDRPTMRRSE